MNSPQKLVIVHPCREFDTSLKCKPFLKDLVNNFEGDDEDILLIKFIEYIPKKSTGKNLYFKRHRVHFKTDRKYQTVESHNGRIEKRTILAQMVVPGARIILAGGLIGQCYDRALFSLGKFAVENKIEDVNVFVPFDGCFIGHTREKLSTGEIFDGTFHYDYYRGIEVAGNNTHTLREVITKTYADKEEAVEAERGYGLHLRRQLRDKEGKPIHATKETITYNIEHYFCIFMLNSWTMHNPKIKENGLEIKLKAH